MVQAQIEIVLIASVVAASCALIGSFLVLRRMALMSDAISHAILLGIVLMFFVVESTTSPWLILAAAATGLFTVLLVEVLGKTGLVKEDAAIGLVFPLLFSLGVILISRYASNIHLDVDAVLLGELAFAPFDRLVVFGADIGPKALWISIAVGAINLAFVTIFYKELKLATFDAGLAAALGFVPAALHYALMSLVSLTAVSSFEAAGSVLVVALMIAPPAAAYLLTDRLPWMLGLAAIIGVLSAVSGFALARLLDASIAGSMATMTGVAFMLAFLFAPNRGLVGRWLRRRRQRRLFAGEMLLVHLSQHEGQPALAGEATVEHMSRHMQWEANFGEQVVSLLVRQGLLARKQGGRWLELTEAGRILAREVMIR